MQPRPPARRRALARALLYPQERLPRSRRSPRSSRFATLLLRAPAAGSSANGADEGSVAAATVQTKEILQGDQNVPNVAAPVTVVGDIHGQFYDMLELFRIGGACPGPRVWA